ncbi:hypothetical protein ACFLYS_03145 [Chloroflexota bacterium]
MMKFKFVLVFVLMVLLVSVTAGCIEIGGNKATGGGWFIDEVTENFITFGFNAKPTGVSYYNEDLETEVRDVKGQFQLVDHTDKIKIHGTFNFGAPDLDITDNSAFLGECFVDNDGPHLFGALLTVEAEVSSVYLWIDMNDDLTDNADPNIDKYYGGDLGGGSIKIHDK